MERDSMIVSRGGAGPGGVGVDADLHLAAPQPSGRARLAGIVDADAGRARAAATASRGARWTLPGWTVPEDASPPFEQVYRDHAVRVYRYCLSEVGNASDAEDLAAEVFAAAFAAYSTANVAGGVVLPWLVRIARNKVSDHRRRHSQRTALLIRILRGASDVDRADVEGEVVVRDELRRVVAAMARLSDRDRTLIGLRIAAGLPYAEIGALVGISGHAATVATGRALQRLRRHLEVPR